MISIVIPVYNASETILKSIESVLNQTYKGDIEIIIINDGSTDDSLFVIEDYCKNHISKGVVIENKENGGASSARNAGMKLSKGEFIALLDSDDEWLPTKLERQISILRGDQKIDFLGCSRNNETLKILWKKIRTMHKITVRELLIKTYPQTSTVIFKRKLYEQFGGYNEKLTHCEDINLWVRYCTNSNLYYLPESLVITGNGKPSFGHTGLSANLKAMEEGNEFTLREAKRNGIIGPFFFYVMYIYSKAKYLRRILLTKLR